MGRRKSEQYMPGMEYFWIKEYLRLNPIKHPVHMDALLSQLRRMYKDGVCPEFRKWYMQLKQRIKQRIFEKRTERQRCFDAFRVSRCFKSRLFRLRILQRARRNSEKLHKLREKLGKEMPPQPAGP